MDINTVRAFITLVLFIAFVGLIVFVTLKGKHAYDEAANLPFLEDNDD